MDEHLRHHQAPALGSQDSLEVRDAETGQTVALLDPDRADDRIPTKRHQRGPATAQT
jgi:hypothetical protein